MSEALVFPVRPYSLPLTRDQFETALRSGHGRALQHVREYDADGWDDIIVYVLTHAHRHDIQIEDDRTVWLLEVMDASGRGETISERVIAKASEAVNTEQPDWKQAWDALQRTHVLAELTKRGDQRARAALYALPERDARGELLAAREIIEIDGAAGLIEMAQRLGADPQKRYAEWEGQHLMDILDEGRTEGAGRAVLEEAAATSLSIAAFLAAIDEEEREREARVARVEPRPQLRASKLTVPIVVEGIRGERQDVEFSAIMAWAGRVPVRDLQALVDALVEDAEAEPARILQYLRILRKRVPPRFDERLLRVAVHPDERVRNLVYSLLGRYRHPAVRDLALRQVREGQFQKRSLSLFLANLEPGDPSMLVEGVVSMRGDDDEFHGGCMGLLDLYEENRSAKVASLAIFVYEYTPCAQCRSFAIKHLLDHGHAPQWMISEAKDDGDDYARKLARGEIIEDSGPRI